MEDIKKQFPIFDTNPDLVYLDNGATTQKPHSVIEAMVDFYTHTNANVHRGLYPLSENATELYELARKKVAKFINAEPEEIIFTGSTTDAINGLVDSLWESEMIGEDSNIVLTELEHHANVLPWQGTGNLHYLPVSKNFEVKFKGTPKDVDVLAITHISNVTGTTIDISKARESTKPKYLVVDAAQSVAHMPIDVKELDVDFMAFSAHKMYGPTGIGVLYGKKEYLEKMDPFRVGGGMIRSVSKEGATWAEIPEKFEAGTPPIAQAIGLAAAIDFITEVGWKDIQSHEEELNAYAYEKLMEVEGLKLYHPENYQDHGAVFSFSIDGIHPHDLSQILGESGVAVRAGHHCTQILHKEVLDISATTRASFGVYNSKEDIDLLVEGINGAISKLH